MPAAEAPADPAPGPRLLGVVQPQDPAWAGAPAGDAPTALLPPVPPGGPSYPGPTYETPAPGVAYDEQAGPDHGHDGPLAGEHAYAGQGAEGYGYAGQGAEGYGYAGHPAGPETAELRPVELGGISGGGRAGRRREGRRGPGLPLVVGAAAVAVIGVGVLTAGLLGDDGPSDRALPDPKLSAPAITGAPEGPTTGPTAPAELPAPGRTGDDAGESRQDGGATGAPTPTATGDPGTGPSPTAPSTAPEPTPTRTRATPPATTAPTLGPGDSGAEVLELQERLAEFRYYSGPLNGKYVHKLGDAVARFQRDVGIRDDPEGVYGPATRRILEHVTHEP
ncbi:peptidoglycan-binding domain-containing protein [Streptomyces sp. NPDC089919]|uniref:peptidoglycan-binding domain-containing protein n=1 Tax=Streptomyces sp. NPDC089919 TaxID=3155188 RepID=UPI00341E2E07